ncbi:GMC family oxidoreductase [Myxococcota bacterium]|nr:GMC family oxidoreductase [Myxococcota bacterium]
MIYDASLLPLPARVRADLCVVGSGPGGATAAAVAAEAGLDVVLLEAGPLVTPGQMTQREEEMLPLLYWHAGGRTTSDRAVRVHQGRGVGGSSLHNINLCKRIPAEVREGWRRDRGLERLDSATWDSLYDEVEALLGVGPVPEGLRSRHNRLLERGCQALGWEGGWLSHNRDGCVGSGFCEIGCAYDAKNNALKVMIPRLVRAGGRVITRCQAVRVVHRGGRAVGVEAVALPAGPGEPLGRVTIEAGQVCLSASATGTPALLLRSRVPDPGGETGRGLRVHPGIAAAGEFEEPVRAWEGIPQSYECTRWLGFAPGAPHRSWILPAFGHPMGLATMIPGHGAFHRQVMAGYAHLAAFSTMLHDHTAGTVRPDGDLDVSIGYRPDEADRRELAFGLAACARLLLAAGARRVMVPTTPPTVLLPGDDPGVIAEADHGPGGLDLTAVHPMSSVPMGDDPRTAAVDSAGRHHHLPGLWIADASLFPTSIGVPPQVSVYAMGFHVGRALVAEAGRRGS